MAFDRDSFFSALAAASLAAVGGLIGGLMRKEIVTVRESVIGALGAGFVGLLVARLCHGSGMSDDTTFVCVGVAGWLGATRTIDILQRVLAKMPTAVKWAANDDVSVKNEHKSKDKEITK